MIKKRVERKIQTDQKGDRDAQQSAEDVRYFDPQFTTQTPTDSYVETQIGEKNQNLFAGFSYVSNPLDQMLRQRRRLNSDARSRPPTALQINDDASSSSAASSSSSSNPPPFIPQSTPSSAAPPSDTSSSSSEGLSLLTAALKKGGI